jgi:hypothetical protein
MSIVRRLGHSARNAALAPVDAVRVWQSDIPDQGRVVLVGLLLLAGSLLLAGAGPLAIGAPGCVLVAVGLGIRFEHPVVATALVAGAAAVTVAALIVGGMH